MQFTRMESGLPAISVADYKPVSIFLGQRLSITSQFETAATTDPLLILLL